MNLVLFFTKRKYSYDLKIFINYKIIFTEENNN